MSDSVEDMILDGSLIESGVSEEGEQLYTFTDKCRELHPEVWNGKYQEFLDDIYELWMMGYVELEFGETANFDNVLVNEKTFTDADELPENLKLTLEAVQISAEEEYGIHKDD